MIFFKINYDIFSLSNRYYALLKYMIMSCLKFSFNHFFIDCFWFFTLGSYIPIWFAILDDGKLDTESDSGEFWVLFGGFAPIGKKVASDDDAVPEATPAKLYR